MSDQPDPVSLTGEFHGFDVELDDHGVATIVLQRPRRLNALTLTVKRELVEWFTHAQVDESVRVVVITGAGRAFCSGDDISGEPDDESAAPVFVRPLNLGQRVPMRAYGALRMGSQPLARMLRTFDKPTIAALNGATIQSGLTIALACDFRVAAQGAKIGSGTLRFAFTPDDGCHHLLVQHLGLSEALDFVMFNRIVDAEQAQQMRLVNRVVPPSELLDQAHEMASTLASGPQVAMRMVKRGLYASTELSFEQSLEDIATKTAVTDYHDDAHEGVASFREKRAPSFNSWLEGR